MTTSSDITRAPTNVAEGAFFRPVAIGVGIGAIIILILLLSVLNTTYQATQATVLNQFHREQISLVAAGGSELEGRFSVPITLLYNLSRRPSIRAANAEPQAIVDLDQSMMSLQTYLQTEWTALTRLDVNYKPIYGWPADYNHNIHKGLTLSWSVPQTIIDYAREADKPALYPAGNVWLLVMPVYTNRGAFDGLLVATTQWDTVIGNVMDNLKSSPSDITRWIPTEPFSLTLSEENNAARSLIQGTATGGNSIDQKEQRYFLAHTTVRVGSSVWWLILEKSERSAFSQINTQLNAAYVAVGITAMGVIVATVLLLTILRRLSTANLRRLAKVNDALRYRASRLEKNFGISRALTATLSRTELSERTLAALLREFSFYYVALFTLQNDELVLQDCLGGVGTKPSPPICFKLDGPSLNSRAARLQRPVRVNDVNNAPDFHPSGLTPQTRSELVLPLLMEGHILGTLDIHSEQTNAFSTEDELILGGLANQIAIAMHNADLYTSAEEARAEAETANVLKSRFLANMSHELRTPLNSIIGYTELTIKGLYGGVTPQQQKRLETVLRNGQNLLALLNDILDLSKIEAGRIDLFIEEFDISSVVHESVTTLQPLVDQNTNRLQLNCPEDIGRMRTDVSRLKQILFNLLSNATKFTQAGFIDFSVRRETDQRGSDWIVFTITDTGIGMSPEQLGKLFKDFVQVDASTTRKYGGTGLGLSISRRFAQMMGGDITVSSQLGKGSTFTAQLPALVTSRNQQETQPGDETISITNSEVSGLVLVIDDDPTIRDLMADYLGKQGFHLEMAGTGADGLRMAKALHPLAIVLDVKIPDIDGWNVLTTLKSDPETADIPVIMLTMMNDKNKGYALGASDYLTKPINWQRLTSVLHKFCYEGACSILIIEDDDATRELLRHALEPEGWVVAEAPNGRLGLERVVQAPPNLILLDLMMPEMNGFEFIQHLWQDEALRSIPIIVITAMDLTAEDRLALNGYVEQIVQKGVYNREQLLIEVRTLVMSAFMRQRNSHHV